MTRHDGAWLLPRIFDHRPDASKLLALQDFTLEQLWWNTPLIVAQALLLSEIVRTYPAELSMIRRIIKRKKPNLAEMMFFSIKYVSLISVVLTTLVQLTKVPGTDARCVAFSWASNIFTFSICTLVVMTIAWRTSIIFHGQRKVQYLLGAGLALQICLSGWAVAVYFKLTRVTPTGLCVEEARLVKHQGFYQLSTFWYVLWNALFDLAMVTSSSVRLWRSARGPTGFARISALLFANNIHYAIGADLVNIIELVTVIGFRYSVPSYQFLVITIQAMLGMQLLISEQEAVYNKRGATMVSYFGSHEPLANISASGTGTAKGQSFNCSSVGLGASAKGSTGLDSTVTMPDDEKGAAVTVEQRGRYVARRLNTADSSSSSAKLWPQPEISTSVLVTYDEGAETSSQYSAYSRTDRRALGDAANANTSTSATSTSRFSPVDHPLPLTPPQKATSSFGSDSLLSGRMADHPFQEHPRTVESTMSRSARLGAASPDPQVPADVNDVEEPQPVSRFSTEIPKGHRYKQSSVQLGAAGVSLVAIRARMDSRAKT
ncbi:hypothetical protein ACQY0O_006601 [Thecaphora frezii]